MTKRIETFNTEIETEVLRFFPKMLLLMLPFIRQLRDWDITF